MKKYTFLTSSAVLGLLTTGFGFVPTAAFAQDATQQAGTGAIETVIVTSQKRAENIQDVPMSVTALNADDLIQNGQVRLQDLFESVPGLSFTGNGTNEQYLSIRGLSVAQFQNPTVATVIDDVPVGSSLIQAYGNYNQPDLDPTELNRIEVLKGPQGTLYGTDSLGGLIKYVTQDPSMTSFSGRAQVSTVDVPEGGVGYALRGSANVPLSDDLAIRASAFDRLDPGYIDNLTTGKDSVNWASVYGGHVSLLYRPSDDLSIKLGALIQNTYGNGAGFANSNTRLQFPQGMFNQTGLPGTGSYNNYWQLYTATVKAKWAGIDIDSITGYSHNWLQNAQDYTGCCGGYFQSVSSGAFPGASGFVEYNHWSTQKLSQEIRLSSTIGEWLDWSVGGFYSHEVNPGSASFQNSIAADLSTGRYVGLLDHSIYPNRLVEYAVFGDLTVHLTDQFDVQVGARQSWDTQNYQNINVGPGVPGIYGLPSTQTTDVQPPGYSKGTPFTYLITPEYKISPDLTVYGRIATGYRLGGPNPISGGSGAYANVPAYFQPDKTTNFELGIKGDVLDHMLSFAAAAYYIKWSNFQLNVQVQTPAGPNAFTTNAGNAKSEGVEFSVDAHPAEGLTLSAQGSYDDAVLTQDIPPAAVAAGTYGLAGDRLPYSIEFSGGFTANQDIRLTDDWIGFIGGSVTYVGSRPYEFASDAATPRITLPGYTQLNLKLGARSEEWRVDMYLNNVTDTRGILGYNTFGANLGNLGTGQAIVLQPLTIGVNVSKSF